MARARIVLFGDTHLGFDDPAHPRTDRRRRGEDFFANFQRVLDHAAATRPDVLVHGGDVFHRSRVHPAVADRAFSALGAVADLGIPVLLVPGNHDRSRLPPSLWLGHPNIHVFDRARTVVIAASDIRLAFAGFPYAWGDLRQAFSGLLSNAGMDGVEAEARFLCMHHTVAGAVVGPVNYTFRSGRDVVPPRQLPEKLTAVLGGHIHRAQVLRSPAHPPVFYPGSTERTSFAEQHEDKGFYDLTVEASPGGTARISGVEFMNLPARPMVDLDLPEELEPRRLRTFLESAARECPPDSVVRIKARRTSPAVLAELSAANLRSVFPPTMNVEVAGGAFIAGG